MNSSCKRGVECFHRSLVIVSTENDITQIMGGFTYAQTVPHFFIPCSLGTRLVQSIYRRVCMCVSHYLCASRYACLSVCLSTVKSTHKCLPSSSRMTTVELFCSSATPFSPWGTESTTTSSSVVSTTSSSKITTEMGRDVGAVAVGEKEREKAPDTKSRPAVETENTDEIMSEKKLSHGN